MRETDLDTRLTVLSKRGASVPRLWAGGFTLAGFVARRLVADALLARDPAAVVPFNRGSLHAAALSWADSDATWADANCGVGVVPSATVPIVAVVAVPPDLNIDALGHLDALGLGRSDERGSRQHRCGCRRHDKSDQRQPPGGNGPSRVKLR